MSVTPYGIQRYLEAQPADEIGDRYCQITPDGDLLPYTDPPTYPVLTQWHTGFRGVDDLVMALDPDVDAAVTEWHRQAKPAYFADDLFGIRAAIGVRNAGRAYVDRAPIGARAAITTKPTLKQGGFMLTRAPYVDTDPFGTRAAIEARKAPTVPPEVAEWQPGPWRWARGRDEWVCGPFRAGEDVHGPYVAMPVQVPRVHGRTYAEAVDTMRRVCLRALGRGSLPASSFVGRCMWSVRPSDQGWHATLTVTVTSPGSTIRSARESRSGLTEAAATYALQSSGTWQTLLAFGVTPERVP